MRTKKIIFFGESFAGLQKTPIFASQLRKGAFSSAGSEHLPYKQRVGGSNPSTPTSENQAVTVKCGCFFCV